MTEDRRTSFQTCYGLCRRNSGLRLPLQETSSAPTPAPDSSDWASLCSCCVWPPPLDTQGHAVVGTGGIARPSGPSAGDEGSARPVSSPHYFISSPGSPLILFSLLPLKGKFLIWPQRLIDGWPSLLAHWLPLGSSTPQHLLEKKCSLRGKLNFNAKAKLKSRFRLCSKAKLRAKYS